MEALADGEYDAIVLGTGMKECVIGGLLSVQGKRVLQIDRNGYYGGEGASLNLSTLFDKFQAGEAPSNLGANRDYNIDLIPKFIMATGNLTKMLLHTKVTRYLEFKSIAGSYVYKGGQILKVPATPQEALSSSLMGLFEKRRFRNFLIYIDAYVATDPNTHQGRDLTKMTMRQLYTDFGLVPDTHQFISHAMCLQLDETHMDAPALQTVTELQTYMYSLKRYGTSPYIYPLYGLGGLPEGFSRICAIHGGTFMLNQDIDEILFNDNGEAYGVRAGNQMAKASMVIGDPSYFPPEKIQPTGVVVRCICLLNHVSVCAVVVVVICFFCCCWGGCAIRVHLTMDCYDVFLFFFFVGSPSPTLVTPNRFRLSFRVHKSIVSMMCLCVHLAIPWLCQPPACMWPLYRLWWRKACPTKTLHLDCNCWVRSSNVSQPFRRPIRRSVMDPKTNVTFPVRLMLHRILKTMSMTCCRCTNV